MAINRLMMFVLCVCTYVTIVNTFFAEARGPPALPVSSVASSIPPSNMFGPVPCSAPQTFSSALRSYLSSSQFPRNEMVHHNTVPPGIFFFYKFKIFVCIIV